MRKTLLPLLMLLALSGPALSETVTITTTLGERGFPQGLLLSGRQSSSVYLPLPAGADVSNVRIGMQALAVAPNLQRGSVVIFVNGQPADALRLGEDPRARRIVLDTLLDEGEAYRAPALDIRFRADLIAHAEYCGDSFDPADSLQVLPDTVISYDIDLDAITDLRDALALLPGRPVIELPATVTPAASTAALQLSAMLAGKGHRARFAQAADPDAIVSLRIVAAGDQPAIKLVRAGGKLRIDVPENADIAAFDRVWQAAPAALAGDTLRAETPTAPGALPASTFQPFASLPGPLRVVQTGDLGLDFPMLDTDGKAAGQVRLNLTLAPDWSDARPVITLYLNGQLIAASRGAIGENRLTVPLPSELLLLSNRLTVTVDRAQVEGYCPGANPGHAVQLLPGTGIDYDGTATGGFAIVAEALRHGGTLMLPEAASGEDGLGYLTLAARVLEGLGTGAAPIAVRFGGATAPTGPVVAIGPAGADGLVLPIGQPDVTVATDQALASLLADATRQRLDVKVMDGQALPDPAGIFLGNSSRALLGSEGVIWQDSASRSDPSMVQQARDASRTLLGTLRDGGLFWWVVGLLGIAGVVLARALIKGFFGRKASK